MTRQKNQLHKTKEALADALMEMLSCGTSLHKVKVRELTEKCSVDRQTFYYYFKNVNELAQYAYEREIKTVFSSKGIDDISQLGWKERALNILTIFEGRPMLRKSILPALGDKAVRVELWNLFYKEMEQAFLPHLIEAGMAEDDAAGHTKYITYMLESTLMGWLNEEVVLSATEILDGIEEMLSDYVAGVSVRLQG